MKNRSIAWVWILFQFLLVVALTAPLYGQHGRGDYRPEELVCEMLPGYSIDIINTTYGTSTKGHLIQTDSYLLSIPAGQNAESLAVVIAARPDVLYCGPNFYFDAPEPFQRSQPFLDNQLTENIDSQFAAQTLALATVHTISTGESVAIAVIDGGVNLTHPEFASMTGGLVSGWDYIDGDSIANDEAGGACSGHGTFVAGVLKLVAPGSYVHAYRVLDTTGRGSGFDIAAAVLRAIDDGCRVINLSLGMVGVDDALDEALKYARMENIMVVASAGNDSTSDNIIFPFPASRTYCLAVAALDTFNLKADFSNYGVKIDYCAPGTGIYAPYLDSSYAWWDGTSFSAPFVSGLAALLISKNPTLTVEKIDTIMANTAADIDTLNPGLEGMLGHGLINMVAALGETMQFTAGDANDDTTVDVGDVIYIINYVFKDGPAPVVTAAANANCDTTVNIGDAVYLVKYVFASGPPPCAPY